MEIYVAVYEMKDGTGRVCAAEARTEIKPTVGEGYGCRALKRLRAKIDEVITQGLMESLREGEG